MPSHLVVASAAAVVAIAAMAAAPALGALADRVGIGENITPGTSGIAHYSSGGRRVDVQLERTDRVPDLLGGAHLTVRLLLTPAPGSSAAGCSVELYTGSTVVATPPPTGECGAHETVLTFVVSASVRPTSVRVRWEAPDHATLPMV